MLTLNWTTESELAKLSKQTGNAAAFDISIPISVSVPAKSSIEINTGIRLMIPENHWGLIKERYSIAKKDLFIIGGVIDSDYRDVLHLKLYNGGDYTQYFTSGQRVAQLIIIPLPYVSLLRIVSEMFDTDDTGRKLGVGGTTGTH